MFLPGETSVLKRIKRTPVPLSLQCSCAIVWRNIPKASVFNWLRKLVVGEQGQDVYVYTCKRPCLFWCIPNNVILFLSQDWRGKGFKSAALSLDDHVGTIAVLLLNSLVVQLQSVPLSVHIKSYLRPWIILPWVLVIDRSCWQFWIPNQQLVFSDPLLASICFLSACWVSDIPVQQTMA